MNDARGAGRPRAAAPRSVADLSGPCRSGSYFRTLPELSTERPPNAQTVQGPKVFRRCAPGDRTTRFPHTLWINSPVLQPGTRPSYKGSAPLLTCHTTCAFHDDESAFVCVQVCRVLLQRLIAGSSHPYTSASRRFNPGSLLRQGPPRATPVHATPVHTPQQFAMRGV